MIRIALFICAFLAVTISIPKTGYAQVPREVPGQDLTAPNSIRPPARMRIPDSFARHDGLPGPEIREELIPLREIRKVVRNSYPGRIVDVRLLVPKREGLNYLYDVRVLTEAGKLLSIRVDAKNAQIVDVRG